MKDTNRDYWVNLVEKLNTNSDLNNLLPAVLEDLCTFFDFGASFIYQANHTGMFFLRESFAVYEGSRLSGTLDLKTELGPELYGQLRSTRVVAHNEGRDASPLGSALAAIFGANSIVIVPVLDQKQAVLALVGILDRRRETRHMQEDIDFAYSVISTLATYIKMQLFQRRIESTHRALDSILNNMGIDVYVNDFYTHEILYLNKSMAAPYGEVDDLIGQICWKTWYDDMPDECAYCPQKKIIDENGNPTKVYSWDYQRPFDGSWFRVLSGAFRWSDGRLAHVVSSIDITETKRNEEIIRQLAEMDHLTGLPNRFKLTQDMDNRIPSLKRAGHDGYLLFFDLDGFKGINDQLGHRVGDELLAQIARTLMDSPLMKDKTYRYGGDEFVVLCDDRTPGTVQQVIGFLMDRFSRPWQLDEYQVSCGTSIGVSHYPHDEETTAGLLRAADQAMYFAKVTGKGRACFYNRGNICSPEEYYATLAQA